MYIFLNVYFVSGGKCFVFDLVDVWARPFLCFFKFFLVSFYVKACECLKLLCGLFPWFANVLFKFYFSTILFLYAERRTSYSPSTIFDGNFNDSMKAVCFFEMVIC